MNIFIYSDESGVFDYVHNKFFVYAGLIFLSKESRDIAIRKYSKAEKDIKNKYQSINELKGNNIRNKDKAKLFRSLNNEYKFAVVVNQDKVLKDIFNSKKDKQRFLDYVYKMAVKNAFKKLIDNHLIIADEVKHLNFFVDEHTTATNGKYELKEALFNEFKNGTYNQNWNHKFPPIFPKIETINLCYCDSKVKFLIRAADIVANKIYHIVENNEMNKLDEIKTFSYIIFPQHL